MPPKTRGVNFDKEKEKRRSATVSLRRKAKDDELRKAREEEEDKTTGLEKFKLGMQGGLHMKDMMGVVARWVEEDEGEVEEIVRCGALVFLKGVLESGDTTMLKEASWALSNILGSGEVYVVQAAQLGIFTPLVEVLKSAPYAARKESIWSVYNITECGSAAHVSHLVDLGVIPALLDFLTTPDVSVILSSMSTLYNILWWGSTHDQDPYIFKNIFDDHDGFTLIDKLQDHNNAEVSEEASRIADALIIQDREQEQLADVDMAPQAGPFNF
eukprot:TRINITY_DN6302_c0_g1_i1.p1 TRINITY_DN6302_c0_g1~~TRINITY_DN6302_c0_g1_i1.p1  ORF type:complete len:271 (+),score=105.01 TRINITY_DN6302_c0_g1_i1:44-856(+)